MIRHPIRATTLAALSTLTGLALTACGGGGGGSGAPPTVDPLRSSLVATPPFGTPADGLSEVQLDVLVADASGRPLRNRTVVLEVTGLGNQLIQPGPSDGAGTARGRLKSSVGELKTVTAVIDPGPDEVRLTPVTTEFLKILPSWYFVRDSGSDGNDGRSPLTAWATLGHALTRVGPGDTVLIGAGTYAGALTVSTQASADEPLTLRGDPLGEFTGDAGEVLIEAGAAPSGILLDGATGVVLRSLSVRGSTGAGIAAQGASDCAILECLPYENQRGIDLMACLRMSLEENRVSANLDDGLSVSAADDTSIVQNLIYANGGDGIDLVTPSTGLEIEFNTLYRNLGDQIHERLAGGTGSLSNNVLSEGTGMGLSLAGGTSLSTAANLAWLQNGNNPQPVLIADPMFVDPFGLDGILGGVGSADDDFRTLLGSPSLDAGTVIAQERLLRVQGVLSALTTREDELPDGTGADLPQANLGFHYKAPSDPFGSLASRGARASFGLAGESMLRTRSWNPLTDAWSPNVRTVPMSSDVRWIVHRVSPLVQPEEVVAVLADTGTGTQLFTRVWDGRRWSDEVPSVTSTAIASANSGERGFDLEYEALSGHALLVHVDGAQNVLFQTLVDGEWSAPAPVFTPALATGTVLWTELVPRPGSNQLALVALDDLQRLFAAIWDGSQWTLPLLLDTRVNATHDWKAFDAAWEGISGDLVVSWGYNLFIEETRFATLKNGVWITGQHNSTDALGLMVSLASDPTSDRIAGIFGEGDEDDDVGVSVWDGSHWANTAEFALQGQPNSRAFEVGWLGTSGLAFAVYRDQALTGAFQWAVFNSGGWKKQGEVTLPGVGKIMQAESRVLTGTNRVLMLLLDEAGSLFATEYTGSAWVLKNDGQPLATGLDPATKGRNFDLDLRRL